jgi:3-polyprenyl-4-hydroxybenzoate decarboxylase
MDSVMSSPNSSQVFDKRDSYLHALNKYIPKQIRSEAKSLAIIQNYNQQKMPKILDIRSPIEKQRDILAIAQMNKRRPAELT